MSAISSVNTKNASESPIAAAAKRTENADFGKHLAALDNTGTKQPGAQRAPIANRFQQLAFLAQPALRSLPQFLARRWQPAHGAGAADRPTAGTGGQRSAVASAAGGKAIDATASVRKPAVEIPGLPLSAFPRPKGDTGRGVHWIPTVSQTPEVIDRYVAEAAEMGMKWITFLNEGTKTGANDYLVERLVENEIEPVMRLYTDGGAPLEGDVASLVRHYKSLGVRYFQLYNEPNLQLENQGGPPDPQQFAAKWLDAAREVVAAGGFPGFGSLSPTPGLAPGAAPGDMDDLAFLQESLQEVKRLGGADVLGRSWLSVHNYGQAHLRTRDYDRIVQEELGRSMPQIGTEAGIYPGDTLSPQAATEIVAGAYDYLPQREDYYFAYTYWIIANDAGTGLRDGAWDHQAMFKPNGEQSELVRYLKDSVA